MGGLGLTSWRATLRDESSQGQCEPQRTAGDAPCLLTWWWPGEEVRVSGIFTPVTEGTRTEFASLSPTLLAKGCMCGGGGRWATSPTWECVQKQPLGRHCAHQILEVQRFLLTWLQRQVDAHPRVLPTTGRPPNQPAPCSEESAQRSTRPGRPRPQLTLRSSTCCGLRPCLARTGCSASRSSLLGLAEMRTRRSSAGDSSLGGTGTGTGSRSPGLCPPFPLGPAWRAGPEQGGEPLPAPTRIPHCPHSAPRHPSLGRPCYYSLESDPVLQPHFLVGQHGAVLVQDQGLLQTAGRGSVQHPIPISPGLRGSPSM